MVHLSNCYGEPVTTSATGKPQKVSEVPANMEIITQDDIRRYGADNIPEILQFVTGIKLGLVRLQCSCRRDQHHHV
jgi:outer membrane receptor for ferrienterochelin and colicins